MRRFWGQGKQQRAQRRIKHAGILLRDVRFAVWRYKGFHMPPTKPSIGANFALYAIFVLSLIQ